RLDRPYSSRQATSAPPGVSCGVAIRRAGPARGELRTVRTQKRRPRMEQPPPEFWAAAALAAFVRDQASWRRTQAARFPADPRNARSAAALDELADFITSLDVGDRHLGELITLEAFDDHDRFRPSDELRR